MHLSLTYFWWRRLWWSISALMGSQKLWSEQSCTWTLPPWTSTRSLPFSHVYHFCRAAQTSLRNRHTHTSCFAQSAVLHMMHLGSARTFRLHLPAHSQMCWRQSLLLGGFSSQTWEVCRVLIMKAICSQALYYAWL